MHVDIANFKCFEHLRLALTDLTLLTGFNAGGKSSAIQPLLLLAQSLRTARQVNRFPLNGVLVQLGTAGDVLPSDRPSMNAPSTVKISVSGEGALNSWELTGRAGDRHLDASTPAIDGVVGSQPTEKSDSTKLLDRIANLSYLSAVRAGSSDAFPIPDSVLLSAADVGIEGQFGPYWYDQLVDSEVVERRRYPGEKATTFRKQADAWLGSLFPGAQVSVQLVSQISQLSLQFRLSEIAAWRRPANVGYGLSYAFPIIAALLAATDGQLIIIDSPEAHLHPSAQSQMGRMLAQFAAAGIQIIVESHSDHLLNGVRLAVKEKTLSAGSLAIHFFTGVSKEGHGVVTPVIDIGGRINEWPVGFFDQSEIDLSRLSE
jgi:CRISPR-associated Cas5-like protein